MVSDWWRKNTSLSIPKQCHLCGLNKAGNGTRWCSTCLTLFSKVPRCQRCGITTPTTVEQCGQCLTTPPSWHRLYCVGDYNFPLSRYVHQLKYSKQFWFARDLASLLTHHIEQPAPIIASVPLHWTRTLSRGFNQSALLSHYLAKSLNVSAHPHMFSRTRATPYQQGLTKKERRQNLHNAFKLRQQPHANHVAILDDVVTTGSTVQHLCQLLLEVGVERIDIYCICRTPEPLQ
ncbi:ComF family protein [Vibrio profundi]|uniref:ComF family protein n=1 Tax=Vibrio profundi TaxID=1774960 RepID=UPI003736B4A3